MPLTLGNWSSASKGTPLNLSGWTNTFTDDFNTMSISNGGSPSTVPWAKWYSDSLFDPPNSATFVNDTGPNGPFSVSGGNLTITMEKNTSTGAWESGGIQTVNRHGQGWYQEGGYFEMRAKFPSGIGPWPAFWLGSQNRYGNPSAPPETIQAEYDIIEAYAIDGDGHHTVTHARRQSTNEHVSKSLYTDLPTTMFDGQFHTYGGMITEDWLITYYDGQEIARQPNTGYFNTPMYMKLDLAIVPQERSQATGPYDMVVDYVKAWKPGTGGGTGVTRNGTSGDDTLTGTAGADTLNGFAGNDRLDGLGAADTMSGSTGDDTYFVDNAGDIIIEPGSGGTDSMFSSVSRTLEPYVNNLTLTGTDPINGSGNVYPNRMTGNAAANALNGKGDNDTIDGKGGNDSLTGEAGLDAFVFTTPLSSSGNVDRITDFTVADDTIRLENSVFAGLSAGALPSSAFVNSTRALDSSDRVIYDRATGNLSHDPDGTGSAAAVLFAKINAGLVLSAADFQVT
jgi:Ca2+-binding RTX toxin-like protein